MQLSSREVCKVTKIFQVTDRQVVVHFRSGIEDFHMTIKNTKIYLDMLDFNEMVASMVIAETFRVLLVAMC